MKAEENVGPPALPQEPTGADWKASKRVLLVLICMALVALVVAIDASILVTALPKLASALHGSANETFWAGSSYLLASSTMQPLLVGLSDIWGRRSIVTASVLFFTIGTLICCLAGNFGVLLTGRTLQGIGGGGIIVLNLVVMTDLIPLRFRPQYTGIAAIAAALGTVTGPLIGAAIVEHSTWRWIFYLNFPICAIGLISLPWVIPSRRDLGLAKKSLLDLDWMGSFLLIAGSTAFLMGITWARHPYGWKSVQVVASLCLGAVGLVATVLWDLLLATHPFIRRSMLRDRCMMTAYACTVLQGLTLYAAIYYLCLFMEAVKHHSPIATGVIILPISIGLIPSTGVSGILISRLGRWRWAIWSGWVLNTFTLGLVILLHQNSPIVGVVFLFLVFGIGQGLLFATHNFAVQAIASIDDVANATALFAFFRSFGFCLGVALGGTIFQEFLQTYLKQANLPTSIAQNAEGYVRVLNSLPHNYPMRQAVSTAYAEAFRDLFAILTGISALGLVLSLTLRNYSLDKMLPSKHASGEESLSSVEMSNRDGFAKLPSLERVMTDSWVSRVVKASARTR